MGTMVVTIFIIDKHQCFRVLDFHSIRIVKSYLAIRKEQVLLNVGAASSREIHRRGWKPLPHRVYLMELGLSR
jgi:hypothetical protein